MPQQISALQLYNLQHIISGDIPLTARRMAGIADWTDHYRRMSMGTTSLDRNVGFGLPVEKPKLRVMNETVATMKGWSDDYRISLPGDTTHKINRQMSVTRSFLNSLNEEDWDNAKYFIKEYGKELPGLQRAYDKAYENVLIKKYMKELELLYAQGYTKGIAFQCVAFIIGYIQALYGNDMWLGAVGGETAGQLLKSAPKDFTAFSLKNDKGEYTTIPSGSVMSNYGIWWDKKEQKNKQTSTGHTYMVLNDLGDELLILEQAGELATSDMPYFTEEGGDNLSEFTWKVGTAAFSGDTGQSKTVTNPRYYSYYNKDEEKYMLTMMPRIRKLKKSYFEGYDGLRTPTIAAPVSSAVQKAVSAFGDKYNK